MKLREVLQTAADTINNAHAAHKHGMVVNWDLLGKAHDLLLAARDELEKAPAVKGSVEFDAWGSSEDGVEPYYVNTHSARLVDMEEIRGGSV